MNGAPAVCAVSSGEAGSGPSIDPSKAEVGEGAHLDMAVQWIASRTGIYNPAFVQSRVIHSNMNSPSQSLRRNKSGCFSLPVGPPLAPRRDRKQSNKRLLDAFALGCGYLKTGGIWVTMGYELIQWTVARIRAAAT